MEDVSLAAQSGGNAGMSPGDIRRLVEGAKLASQSGRMSFADAVKAGAVGRHSLDNVSESMTPAEAASSMVNRESRAKWNETAPEMTDLMEAMQQAVARAKATVDKAFDQKEMEWVRGGSVGPRPERGDLRSARADEVNALIKRSTYQPMPGTAPGDFASAQSDLAASPIAAAVEADRRTRSQEADLALQDVSDRGVTVIKKDAATARAARRNPGLEAFLVQDRKLQEDITASQKAEDAWGWNPWSTTHNETKKLADERMRRVDAFRKAGGFVSHDDVESPEAFLARGDAQRAKVEAAGKAAGVPFGAGVSRIESLLERIAQGVEDTAPAPLQESQ